MSRIVYRITDEYAIVQRKGSAKLYLEWRENGQKVGRSTGCESLDDAKRRARELILELAEIRNAEPEEAQLLAVLDRYFLKRGVGLASKTTAKRALSLWREFWTEDATIASLTVVRQEEFIEWLRAKGFSDGYVRRVVGFGRTATNWAWKRSEVRQIPFIELPPEGDPYPHSATRSQLVTLLNTEMPQHVWRYILIRLNTGCRGDAALQLGPPQIDWHGAAVRLNPAGRRQTKKRRPVVPLTQTLAALLRPLEGLGHYAGWNGRRTLSIKTTWRKIRRRAGLPIWFAPKVLRHTVASELRRRGIPKWDVSGLLGHEDGDGAAITGDYAKFDGAKVSKALDAWMADLARDVPALRGVIAGSAPQASENGGAPKGPAVQSLKLVGDTGFEPVTPTMSR